MTTPFEAKGWKATDKFRVVANKAVHDYNIGTVVKLCWDDETNQPEFTDNNGYRCYCDIDTDLERIEPEWNGEGFPPVGTVCEYQDYKGDWHKIFIIARYGDGTFIEWRSDTYTGCDLIRGEVSPDKFRPIRTEREKGIEAMLDLLNAGTQLSLADAIEQLYDAGYRKQ